MVVLVDKPYGVTSFDVVHEIRKVLSKKLQEKIKIGHAGTLDPLATGLLILCTGRLTKEIDLYQGLPKEYSGIIALGAIRPTYDRESEVSETFELPMLDLKQLEDVRLTFLGFQELLPPAHSAVKVKGIRAYKLARKGIDMELKPRPMNIERFDIKSERWPMLDFYIACSKGTYIRTIANEFGLRMNNGGYLHDLRREKIGNYSVNDAWKLPQLIDFIQRSTSQELD